MVANCKRVAYWMLIFYGVLPIDIQAKCPTHVIFWQTLKQLEGSDNADSLKIVKLDALADQFLSCGNKPDSTYALILHRLGALHIQTGNMEKAMGYTQTAISINKSAIRGANKSYLANSYYNLATIYSNLYLNKQYLLALDSCLMIVKQFPAKNSLGLMALTQKAYLLYQTGDYQESIETADLGIILAQRIGDWVSEGSLLSQRAQSLTELGRLNPAQADISKAITIFSEDPAYSIELATAYAVYAQLLSSNSKFQQAIQYFQKSINLNKSAKNWLQCSRDLLNLGYVYDHKLKNYESALKCYNQGLAILKKSPDDYQKAGLYINIGVVYWRQKNFGKALEAYQKALKSLPLNFSDDSIARNPSSKTLELITNEYFVYVLLSNKAEALLDLYKTEKQRKWLKLSIDTYRLADNIVDQMRWKQAGDQSKLFWRERTRKTYENAIEACYLASDARLAFFFMEKSRAVLLNDKLNELGASATLPMDERSNELKFRAELATAEQRLGTQPEKSVEQRAIMSNLLEAKSEFANYIRNLEFKYPAYYQYKYNAQVPQLSTLQAYLKLKNAGFIHYFTGDSVTYMLAISPTSAVITKLLTNVSYHELDQFRAICSNKQTQQNSFQSYASLSNKLYRTFFKPCGLPKGKIIISADQLLIPFDALSEDSNGQNTLIKNYTFSYVYSARLLLKKPSASRAKGDFIGFAPVIFQPQLALPDLSQSATVISDAAAYYSRSKVIKGKESSRKNFLDQVGRYRIANVFSHASGLPAGSEPRLYMQDSVIRLSELVFPNEIATQLIILSACETNVGQSFSGEGVFSLARGFSAGGIPSVAATLWTVDEDASYSISVLFHKYISQGMDMDDALRRAKLDFLESNDREKQLPYYWAGIVLIGSGEAVKLTNYDYLWIVGLVLLFLALAAFAIFQRSKMVGS